MPANKNNSVANAAKDAAEKTSIAIFGTEDKLRQESERISEIVNSSVKATKEKFGKKTSTDIVGYFNEVNFAKIFAQSSSDPEIKASAKTNPNMAFRRYMSKNEAGAAEAIMRSEADRLLLYSNYLSIYTYIPECAQAIDLYRDNIISADDFTKISFNVDYDNKSETLDADIVDAINVELQREVNVYNIDEIVDTAITQGLILGDQYIAVLPIADELEQMLSELRGEKHILNESVVTERMRLMDEDAIGITVNSDDVKYSGFMSLCEAFEGAYTIENKKDKDNKDITRLNEDQLHSEIAKLVNEHVIIGSKNELILESCLAEDESSMNNVLSMMNDRFSGKSNDNKPRSQRLKINGSSVKLLNSQSVIELKVDNICYGYYVIETDPQQFTRMGPNLGSEMNRTETTANIALPSITNSVIQSDIKTNFSSNNVSDEKIGLISKVFLNVLSKRLNKSFITKNANMANFVYQLVKQNYILQKDIKVTFLNPDEVIAIHVPSVFRKITLFAKIYLAELMNTLLINMGRSHDKRIYYVETGLDDDYQQAINELITDVKTKEFKLDSIADINSILNLNPGKFDDYYMPIVNGNRPIEIDTLQGMNAEMSNDFLDWLKNSILNGMDISAPMLDAAHELDFARTLSATNANFVRAIIRYQKKFTPCFKKLMQLIFMNEHKFCKDEKLKDVISNNAAFDINNINLSFPSPSSLIMSTITEQSTTAESTAEFILNTLVPEGSIANAQTIRINMKKEIIRDLMPMIDWNKYSKMLENSKIQTQVNKVGSKDNGDQTTDDYDNF